jgi:hypothetical protein
MKGRGDWETRGQGDRAAVRAVIFLHVSTSPSLPVILCLLLVLLFCFSAPVLARMDTGRDKAARRESARLDSWQQDERSYAAYAQALANLLALERSRFNPAAVKIEDLIPKRAMGEHNNIDELQNYVVGLEEQLGRHEVEGTDPEAPGLSEDERLVRRFRRHQRRLAEGDMLVVANDHWNFDVRGFNSGGNHGSFLRVSTHATLLFADGERTGIPRGLDIAEPYDSLSFVPTILALTGQLEDGTRPVPALWRQGFRTFPGRVINELFTTTQPEAPLADTTAQPEEKR